MEAAVEGSGLRFFFWVAIKEQKLSYHNGYKNNRVSPE